MKRIWFVLLTFFVLGQTVFFGLQTFDTPDHAKEIVEGPWLTGPLLTPSSEVVPFGHFNFETFVYASKSSHVYNHKWHREHVPTFVSVVYQFPFAVGFCKSWDFQIIPQFSWQHSKGQAKTVFNDLAMGVDYQVLGDKPGAWYPVIKASLFETFPTGKYQHLNPDKNETDIGGKGSFQTMIGLTFSKLFDFYHKHWLNIRLGVNYVYLAPLHVDGVNAYGGVNETHGKIFPGNTFNQILGIEFTLNQNWVLALDILNTYINKNRFKGHRGFMPIKLAPVGTAPPADLLPPPTPAQVGGPSLNQISLAPSVEYNWNANLGIIAGAWFTIAGRNASDFIQWVIAFNLYH